MTLSLFASPLALIAAFALQAEPEAEDPNSTFSSHNPVRMVPVPAARAFAAFRDVCMTPFPDFAGFDRAAAAAGLELVQTGRGDRIREWSSRHGHVVLRQARNPGRMGRAERRARREGSVNLGSRERWAERCDFRLAIEERLEPAQLVAAIGAALAPETRAVEEIIGHGWTLAPPTSGGTLRLVLTPEEDPRLFTLSLQRVIEVRPR